MLLYAVFFGAFGHLGNHQLAGSPFSSVVEGQTRVFEVTRALFHANSEWKGDIALVQTALILSYWSPQDTTTEVNAYWVDHATQHAIDGGFFSEGSEKHQRVIMWCCLVRNRTIVLGLRRPQLLYKLEPGRLPEPADFCECCTDGSIQELKVKRCGVRSFILTCKLSEIMAAIIESRTKVHWGSWWQEGKDMAQILRFHEVTLIDESLNRWGQEYHILCQETEDFGSGATNMATLMSSASFICEF